MDNIEPKEADDVDPVVEWAKKLKNDSSLFALQKMFIDSQIKNRNEFFAKKFAGKDFKTEARKYLRSIGLL